jgi:hypothetical protein
MLINRVPVGCAYVNSSASESKAARRTSIGVLDFEWIMTATSSGLSPRTKALAAERSRASSPSSYGSGSIQRGPMSCEKSSRSAPGVMR